MAIEMDLQRVELAVPQLDTPDELESTSDS